MGELSVIPAWVAPPARQVRDAHCIARALAVRAVEARPVAASFDWVTGGQDSPITQRGDEPAAAVVRAEMMLADALTRGGDLHPDWWDALGVAQLPAVTRDGTWCAGVAAALAWLLGVTERPPVPLPRRLPDGTVPTADQLYAEALRSGRLTGPEERNGARDRAEREAARFRRLAELAASTH